MLHTRLTVVALGAALLIASILHATNTSNHADVTQAMPPFSSRSYLMLDDGQLIESEVFCSGSFRRLGLSGTVMR